MKNLLRNQVWIGYLRLFIACLQTLFAVLAFIPVYLNIFERSVFNTVGREPMTAAAAWFVLVGEMMALLGASPTLPE